ncbi:MAG: class I SAM-dependent methyltransferase [Chloroflexota bacterium]
MHTTLQQQVAPSFKEWVSETFPLEQAYRAHRIEQALHPHLEGAETLLDCGSGSMRVAKLIEKRLGLKAYGTDVIHLKAGHARFCLCAGERLPFADNSFDAVSLMFVLHHTRDAVVAIKECARVARKRVLILEDVYTHPLEKEWLKFLDVLGNFTISLDMPFPFTFKSVAEWERIFADLGLRLAASEKIVPSPLRPSRHRLFLLEK